MAWGHVFPLKLHVLIELSMCFGMHFTLLRLSISSLQQDHTMLGPHLMPILWIFIALPNSNEGDDGYRFMARGFSHCVVIVASVTSMLDECLLFEFNLSYFSSFSLIVLLF